MYVRWKCRWQKVSFWDGIVILYNQFILLTRRGIRFLNRCWSYNRNIMWLLLLWVIFGVIYCKGWSKGIEDILPDIFTSVVLVAFINTIGGEKSIGVY